MTKISNLSKQINVLKNSLSGTNVNLRFTKKGVVYVVTPRQRKRRSTAQKTTKK